ncbi:unnamed protein product [Gongylonema pulchrum]|uniref:Anoct_dimer domain-containing protein n=1 Tax=Gongylonema pulchrum TaxID=637853 RepID=A0A183D6P4_9BILA|nr:unnamed protein product [Gongylonema pulchrum]
MPSLMSQPPFSILSVPLFYVNAVEKQIGARIWLGVSRKRRLTRSECFDYDELPMESAIDSSDSQEKNAVSQFRQQRVLKGLYFKDGKRRIDYVLAYENDETEDDDPSSTQIMDEISPTSRVKGSKKAAKRQQYEANLRLLGLELEHVSGTVPLFVLTP